MADNGLTRRDSLVPRTKSGQHNADTDIPLDVLTNAPTKFQEMSFRLERSKRELNEHSNVVEIIKERERKAKEVTGKSKRAEYNAHEHLLRVEDLAYELETQINFSDPKTSQGLNKTDALRRLELNGPNRLT
eukprot:Colp12_sorted_trinity150504_noHs@12728